MSEAVKGLEDLDGGSSGADYETPKKRTKKSGSDAKSSDFIQETGNLLSNINYKVAIMLFFISMLIFSDLFIDKFLTKFDNAVYGEATTTKGTMIQLIFLVIGYIIADLLVKYDVL
jgi:hypothetical protein